MTDPDTRPTDHEAADPTVPLPGAGQGQPYQQPVVDAQPEPTTFQTYPPVGYPQAASWPSDADRPGVVQPAAGYGYPHTPSALPEHPNAIPSLVLGILSLVVFPPLAPFAWYLGAKGQREVGQNPHAWRSSATLAAGKVLGIIGTVLMSLVVLGVIFAIIAFGLLAAA